MAQFDVDIIDRERSIKIMIDQSYKLYFESNRNYIKNFATKLDFVQNHFFWPKEQKESKLF